MTRLHVSPISGDGALIYRSGNALAYLVGVPVSSLDKVAGRLANAEPVAWMAVLQAFQVTGAAVIDESNDRTRLRYTGMVEIQVLNGSTHPNEPDGSLYVGNDDVRIMHLSVDDRLRINPRPDAMGIGNLEGGSMAVDSLFIRVGEFEEATAPSDAGSSAASGPGEVRASIPLPPISTAGTVVPPGDEVFEPNPTVFHVPLHSGANEAQVIDIAGQTSPGTVDVSPPDVAATSGSSAVANPTAAPSTAFVVEPPDTQTPSAPELVIVEQQTDDADAPADAGRTDTDDADTATVEHASLEPETADPDHTESDSAELGAPGSGADTTPEAAEGAADAAETGDAAGAEAADADADDAADADADEAGDADAAEAADAESDASETTAEDNGSTSAASDVDPVPDELGSEVEAIGPEVEAIEATQSTVVEVDQLELVDAKADAPESDAPGPNTAADTNPTSEDDADNSEETANADDNDDSGDASDTEDASDSGAKASDAGVDGSANADAAEDASEGHDAAQHEVDDGDDTSPDDSDEPESSSEPTQGKHEDDDAKKPKADGENVAAETSSESAPTVFIGAPAKTEKSGFDAPYQPSFKKVPLITKSNEAIVVADEATNAEVTELHDEPERSEEATPDPSPSDQTCVNGHRNKPNAALCSTCGERLNAPSEGGRVFMRPGVVGTLTFDDGEQFDISNDLLVGRAPGTPVIGDTAEFPSDPMMSREHFRIEVDDHSVVVRDLNSSNGTMVRFASDGGYERLLPGEAYPLSDGAVIVAGQRWATFALYVE